MNKKRKSWLIVLALLVCVFLLGGLCQAVCAADFEDVPEDAWYRDPVYYVANNNYFQGTGKDTFDPDGSMKDGRNEG